MVQGSITYYVWLYRVRGGTHGQILLRASTVYISDSEPDKVGSLPEKAQGTQFVSKLGTQNQSCHGC